MFAVSASAGSAGRSRSKRPASSAHRCCASAAEPPLPNASSLPPGAEALDHALARRRRSRRAQASIVARLVATLSSKRRADAREATSRSFPLGHALSRAGNRSTARASR